MKDIMASYRVYSKNEERYIDYQKYSCDELVYLTQDGELLDRHKDVIENVIIERYTGLKDWENIPIYEGDEVMYSNNLTGEVVFIRGCFWIKHFTGFGDYEYTQIYRPLSLKIIGNIHGNPEFWGKKKNERFKSRRKNTNSH